MVLDTALCAVQSVVLHGGFKWVKYCEYRSSKLCVRRYGAYIRCRDRSFSEEPQKMGRGTPAEISRKVSSRFCSSGRGVKQQRLLWVGNTAKTVAKRDFQGEKDWLLLLFERYH